MVVEENKHSQRGTESYLGQGADFNMASSRPTLSPFYSTYLHARLRRRPKPTVSDLLASTIPDDKIEEMARTGRA